MEVIKLTFEEARDIVGISGQTSLAIELMKADAMQKQADAIENINRLLSTLLEKTSYSGHNAIRIKVEK